MKKYSIICAIILILFLFSGCAEKKETKEITHTPMTFSTETVENSAIAEFPEEISSAIAETEPVIVYITNSGTKYHRENCQYLINSKIPVNLNDLDTDFYIPCGVCCP